MLTKIDIETICDTFNLGQPIGELRPIPGGLLHEIYRLETTTGNFAVKLLNPTLVHSDWIEGIILSEKLAVLFSEHQIPTISALSNQHDVVSEIDNNKIMIFPWIEGSVLTPQEIQIKHAQKIGEIVAKIHTVNIHEHGFIPPNWQGFSVKHWLALVQQADIKKISFAKKLQHELPHLVKSGTSARQALFILNKKLVISHRDLDPKNVIWQNDHSPIIIDWESAGLINPGMDLLAAALNWSGQTEGEPKQALFQAVIAGYRLIKSSIPLLNQNAIDGYLGYCIDWLELNVRRSLEAEYCEIAEQEVFKSFAAIKSIDNNREKLIHWYEMM